MAILLHYLGKQCSKLKVHCSDRSLDRRPFVGNDIIANCVSSIRHMKKLENHHILTEIRKENIGFFG